MADLGTTIAVTFRVQQLRKIIHVILIQSVFQINMQIDPVEQLLGQ